MPGASPYRRGREFEYRVAKHLRTHGFFVMRAPASAGAVDLLAIRPGECLFVQCKIGGWVSPAEWNAFLGLARTAGAVPLIASRPKRGALEFKLVIGRKSGKRGERQPFEDWQPRKEATP